MAFELEPWEWHHGCLWRFPHQHLCWEGSLPANLLWTHCARTTQRDLSTRLAISRWHFQRTHRFTYTSDTSGFLGSILYGFPNDLGRFHSSEQRKLTVSFLWLFFLLVWNFCVSKTAWKSSCVFPRGDFVTVGSWELKPWRFLQSERLVGAFLPQKVGNSNGILPKMA